MRSNFARARKQYQQHFSKKLLFVPRHKLLQDIQGAYVNTPCYQGSNEILYNFLLKHVWDDKTKNTPYSKWGDKISKRITHPSLRQEVNVNLAGLYDYKLHYMEGPVLPSSARVERYFSQLPYYYSRPSYPKLTTEGLAKLKDDVAMLINDIKPLIFHLSCKVTDIMRMSVTPHYSSCMRLPSEDDNQGGAYYKQIAYEVANPYVAIVFVRDKAGHFKGRILLRMLRILKTGEFVLGLQRQYGCLSQKVVAKALWDEYKLKCYDIYGGSEEKLTTFPIYGPARLKIYSDQNVYPQNKQGYCVSNYIYDSDNRKGGLRHEYNATLIKINEN